MSRPTLMLLDEPTLGISPTLVQEIFAMLVCLKISPHAFILENGRVLLEEPTSDLRDNQTVQQAYLGRHLRAPPLLRS